VRQVCPAPGVVGRPPVRRRPAVMGVGSLALVAPEPSIRGRLATITGVEFAQDDLLMLSYPERQLIVVDSDAAVEAVRPAANGDAVGKRALDFASSAARSAVRAGGPGGPGGVAGVAGAAAGGAIAAAAVELWKARKRADSANLPYLIVSTSQAANLRFQHGHPLRNVVYVGDPGLPGNYYPVASFHRILFEGKVAEALRLLRSLGATEISVEYVEGFDRATGVDLSGSTPGRPGVEVDAGVKSTKKANSGAKTTMQLSPTMPAQIPKDLIWFRSEPLWQEVANARLENGLRSFTLDVRYTDDFGINAGVKAKIARVGLKLGGTFTEYRETVWKLSVTFAEELRPGSASA
jgi:hypothetical protein